MAFHSPGFLFGFLPIALLGYWLLGGGRPRRAWLVATGIAFYALLTGAQVGLLLLMAAVTFAAGRWMSEAVTDRQRNLGLGLALVNVLVLLSFKATGLVPLPGWVLPIGLSFYTLNLLGYAFDVYWRRAPATSSPLDFAAFATFFPTITSGPILRFAEFRDQLVAARPLGPERIGLALFSIVAGLAKKLLIADPLGVTIEPLFAAHDRLGAWGAWLAILGYHGRIYFDFSGYTDIAVGVAYLFGIRVPPNFDAPYTARSATEFWRRWHITLSNWFRDYVFVPLSFALRGRSAASLSRARTVALFVTFALVGLWHAPTVPYLLWGLYQGALLSIHAWRREKGRPPWPAALGRLATLIALLVGWVILRSDSVGMALGLFGALIGRRGVEATPFALPGVDATFLFVLAMALVLTSLRRDTSSLRPRDGWAYAGVAAAVLVLCVLAMGRTVPFLYFQF